MVQGNHFFSYKPYCPTRCGVTAVPWSYGILPYCIYLALHVSSSACSVDVFAICHVPSGKSRQHSGGPDIKIGLRSGPFAVARCLALQESIKLQRHISRCPRHVSLLRLIYLLQPCNVKHVFFCKLTGRLYGVAVGLAKGLARARSADRVLVCGCAQPTDSDKARQ